MEGPKYHFHGGCMGCTIQQTKGLNTCKGCMYLKPDWSLPDLNNRQLTHAEEVKAVLLAEEPYFHVA